MIEIKGKYNTAKAFTDEIDSATRNQIKSICDREEFKGSKIRIMPDCHAGAGCVIGTTMTLSNAVAPNHVGVDIGCGMLTVKLKQTNVDLENLDRIIRGMVPSGCNGHSYREAPPKLDKLIDSLICQKSIRLQKTYDNMGTLGGGNHFIELDKSSDGSVYLVIHTGSRHLGIEVEGHYRKLASAKVFEAARQEVIDSVKKSVPRNKIQEELIPLMKKHSRWEEQNKKRINAEAYCSGTLMEDYIHDMKITQEYAAMNRREIASIILRHTGLEAVVGETFETIHNYIDTDNMILRKGAVSARTGEKLLIPINMRDGSLICKGLGNPDFNYSAPHGAGRLHSRSEAKELFTLEEYEETMRESGIYTTSVNQSTLDECPMAYKSMEDIVKNIGETVKILEVIKPIYNYKASTEEEQPSW